MRFIDALSDFYSYYEDEYEEQLTSDEKLVAEEFADYLDRLTDSEFKSAE